jgi:hypothetical protein
VSARRENGAIVGVGITACAVCCAGPVLGVLAAIGVGTAADVALFGAMAIVIGAVAAGIVRVRRRRTIACSPADPSVVVELELGSERVRP